MLLGNSEMGEGREGDEWRGAGAGGPGAKAVPTSTLEGSVGAGERRGKGRGPPTTGSLRRAPAPRSAQGALLRLSRHGSDFRESRSLASKNFLKEAKKVNLTLLWGAGGGAWGQGVERRIQASASPTSSPVLGAPRGRARPRAPGGAGEAGRWGGAPGAPGAGGWVRGAQP